MAISKLILNGEVQMDVTSDTVEASKLLSTYTATKNDGTKVTGSIATKSSTDLTASGATVTAPAGYYESSASKSVTTMTLPTSASSSATSGYTSKATFDRSTSDRYLNIPPGYNSAGGYYKISKVSNGSATTPSTTVTANPNISVNSSGLITATASATKSVTPTVSAGYVSSGTAGTITVSGSNTQQLTAQAAQTITPTTSDQTISSGKYLTGAQTIKGDANLIAANIAEGVSIFGITGTHSGGGGGGVSTGTFTISPVSSTTTRTYCGFFMLGIPKSASIGGHLFPILAKPSTSASLTGQWFLDDDGYMYVGVTGANASYWPQLTATSGTATIAGSIDANSSWLTNSPTSGSYDHYNVTVWYRVSDGAVLTMSYYNNN